MSLTLVFRTVTLFFIITPVLADDKASEQEITVNASNIRGFRNLGCQLFYYCTSSPVNMQQLLTTAQFDNL